MIIFLRAYSISKDSRLLKYISICKKSDLDYKIIGWDKDNTEESTDDCMYYRGRFKLGRQWLNIFMIFRWWYFVILSIFSINKKNKVKVIHTVDLDCGIVGLFITKLIGAKHIYDVYDVYSANRNMKGIIRGIVNSIERFVCRKSTYFIMPEAFRFEQLDLKVSDEKYNNFVEIENVPEIQCNIDIYRHETKNIQLAYAGSLEPMHRGLENLLKSVSLNPDLTLDIAGVGPLTDLCTEYSQNYQNIYFHGGITPQQVYELEAKSDIIVGMYYKTRDNHLYASPNKYYEHLALGKTMLTTCGTPPGEKVQRWQTGFAVGENLQDLLNIFQFLRENKEIINQYSINAHEIWLRKYSDYNERKLVKQYLKMVG